MLGLIVVFASLFDVVCHLQLPDLYGKTSNAVLKGVALEQSKSFQHEWVEEVEIFNFHGAQHEFELAMYLLGNVVLLGKMKMKIIRKNRYYVGGTWMESDLPTKIKRSRERPPIPS